MLQFTCAHQNWNMDDWKNNAYNINLQSKTREYQKTKTQTSLIQLNFIKDTHGSIENTHTHTEYITPDIITETEEQAPLRQESKETLKELKAQEEIMSSKQNSDTQISQEPKPNITTMVMKSKQEWKTSSTHKKQTKTITNELNAERKRDCSPSVKLIDKQGVSLSEVLSRVSFMVASV